jgi:serine/threonine-protein kinase
MGRMSSPFTPKSVAFLRALKRHNDREWFRARKDDYERHVRQASVQAAGSAMTQAGIVLGTPTYMSPEQASGDQVDGRSDLYALGCVLHEMLAGHPPFSGPTQQSVIVKHLVENPPDLNRSEVPEAVRRILRTLLAKNPGDRFRTASDARDALRAVDFHVPTPWPAPTGTSGAVSLSGPIDSLAVLPFEGTGTDPDDDYLADGITENILNRLARVSGLRVVPRSTVFRLKGKIDDPCATARDLKVRAVVTGRVQQRKGQLLVSAELTDVVTESQLWGDRLVRSATDIFAVQEEVAAEIVKGLELRLSPDDHEELTRRQTEDALAYDAYLRGRHQWNKRTRDGFLRAIEHFQDAIDRDPRFALADSALADTYNLLGSDNFLPPKVAYPRAKAASTKALAIDPNLAEAHASLGYTRLFFVWDWAGAKESLESAIRLDPGYATAHQWYAWYLLVAGRMEDMIAEMRKALDLDPLSLIINAHMAYALFWAGRHDQALAQARRTVSLDASFALGYWPLGAIHVYAGHGDEAIEAFRSLVSLTNGALGLGYLAICSGRFGRPNLAREAQMRIEEARATRYVSPLDDALCHAALGEYSLAFDRLDRAFDDRVSDLVRLKVLPWPPDMRNDTRFAAAVARLNLPT